MPESPFRNLSGLAGGRKQLPQKPKPEPEEKELTEQEPESPAQVPAVLTNNYLIESLEEACELTPEQVSGLNSYMVKARLGMSLQVAPLICSDKCPFEKKCPLVQNKISLPIGKPCPVEISVMKQYRDELALSIGIDGNDPNSAFDRKLLDDLAFIHMLKMRLGTELGSADPDMAKERIVSYSPQGAPVYGTVVNPRLSVLEKLMKMEKSIMSELMATRRAKFQASGNPDDASKVGATLMGKMEEVLARKMADAKARHSAEVEQIIDADYTVKDANSD